MKLSFCRSFLLIFALLLSACGQLPEAHLGRTFFVDSFLKKNISQKDFSSHLAHAYQYKAKEAAGVKDVNWMDASAYAYKGESALQGKDVQPWDPVALGISSPSLKETYDSLLTLLKQYKDVNPEACAHAQVHYDNWLEELSEKKHSITDPNGVKKNLDHAMLQCEGSKKHVEKHHKHYKKHDMACKKKGKFVHKHHACQEKKHSPYMKSVYFDFDSSRLSRAARHILNKVKNIVHKTSPEYLKVICHTDSAGEYHYNKKLSQERADNVADYLIKNGISPDKIKVFSRSEDSQAVTTPDGTKEPKNRRVEIKIIR